ncbi:spermidine/putrescine-binding protein [Rhizobium sp. BK212]|uniref:hypothetical protein n=1 Tax=Rhizobium sp. BK212 TaxID=2587074 RepID=UPI00160EDE10|nr:hypothetical protein [Rhizobium sp. BK212]MBB4216053.1 spermidine/putrescine-binding protein [Rhizobium sp. BK212]
MELAEMFLSEKVILADAWSNEVALLRDQGLPLGFLIPPNSLAWMELFCVIRGAQLPEVEALLQVLTKPTVLEVVSVAQKLPPSMNPKSHTFSRRVTELPGFDPSGSLSNLAFADANYWSAGNDRWWPDWERIRGSG